MSKIKIFWDPRGQMLDYLGKKRFIRATDGDTPYVSISIRMLSIDTPELHYPGNTKPSKQDDNLAQLAEWIHQGKAPIEPELAALLHPKLATKMAGTLQEKQGDKAKEVFNRLIDKNLSIPNSNRKRNVFLQAADEHFDQYGRLLAYMAPSYTAKERASMPLKDRATFNLMMVESGWAASFPIYPSLPKHADLVLLQNAGESAVKNKQGAWADPMMLTGYEFRMCVKLFNITKKLISGRKLSTIEKSGWISRYCVDMTTGKIYYPQNYIQVKSYNRIFVWSQDATEAVARLNLVPGE